MTAQLPPLSPRSWEERVQDFTCRMNERAQLFNNGSYYDYVEVRRRSLVATACLEDAVKLWEPNKRYTTEQLTSCHELTTQASDFATRILCTKDGFKAAVSSEFTGKHNDLDAQIGQQLAQIKTQLELVTK